MTSRRARARNQQREFEEQSWKDQRDQETDGPDTYPEPDDEDHYHQGNEQ